MLHKQERIAREQKNIARGLTMTGVPVSSRKRSWEERVFSEAHSHTHSHSQSPVHDQPQSSKNTENPSQKPQPQSQFGSQQSQQQQPRAIASLSAAELLKQVAKEFNLDIAEVQRRFAHVHSQLHPPAPSPITAAATTATAPVTHNIPLRTPTMIVMENSSKLRAIGKLKSKHNKKRYSMMLGKRLGQIKR